MTYVGILPATISFQHRVWTPGAADIHGNPTGALGAPINRLAIACYPMHFRNPHTDPISADYVARTETDILVDVPDASLFKKLDQLIFAMELPFATDTGIAFEVQGLPVNWGLNMPIQAFGRLFPGVVHGRRVG